MFTQNKPGSKKDPWNHWKNQLQQKDTDYFVHDKYQLFVGFFMKVTPAMIKRLDTVPIRPNPTESRPKLNPEFLFSATAWSFP